MRDNVAGMSSFTFYCYILIMTRTIFVCFISIGLFFLTLQSVALTSYPMYLSSNGFKRKFIGKIHESLKIKIKGGGQHVNPAVTVSMWALGKVSYTETFVRIAGQMGGGLVAFPCFQFVSEQMNLTPFGGPEFSKENDVDAFLQEFCASFLLMWAIYIVRFPYPFFP